MQDQINKQFNHTISCIRIEHDKMKQALKLIEESNNDYLQNIHAIDTKIKERFFQKIGYCFNEVIRKNLHVGNYCFFNDNRKIFDLDNNIKSEWIENLKKSFDRFELVIKEDFKKLKNNSNIQKYKEIKINEKKLSLKWIAAEHSISIDILELYLNYLFNKDQFFENPLNQENDKFILKNYTSNKNVELIFKNKADFQDFLTAYNAL